MSYSNHPSESINTVLGPVSLSMLGKTLTHEHISCDFTFYHKLFKKSSKISFDSEFIKKKISLRNLSYLRMYPYSMEYNVQLNDVDSKLNSLNELYLFKRYGGKTIVENSSYGLQRDTSSLKAISKETGVNIIVGTGYYNNFMPKLTDSTQKRYHLMCNELIEGCCDDRTVKPGFIGEVGIGFSPSWASSDNDRERRSICAAAFAQQQFNCPVSLNSGWYHDTPWKIMRIFLEAGGNCNKVAMCYVDRTLIVKEHLLRFADIYKNCYLQFSLFGTESMVFMSPTFSNIEILSDAQRIKCIKKLKENRYLDRVLISHNIHTKNKLHYFGGHGYSYILTNIRDRMLKNDFTQTDFDTILEENPKSWLTWNKG